MGSNKLVKEFGAIFSSEVLLLAASFISFPILARLLSKIDYGFMSLVTMSLMLIANLASAGLNNSVLRYFGKYSQGNERLVFVNSLRFTTLALGLVAMFVYLIVSSIFHNVGMLQSGFFSVLIISSLLIPIRAMTKIELSFLRISDHIMLMNLYNLFIRYGGIGASICLIYWYKYLSALYIGTIIAETLVLIIIYVVISIRINELSIDPSVSAPYLKESFSYGLPLAVSGLLSYFLSSTDRYVISFFLSVERVADYTVAINFCNYPIEVLRNVYLSTFVPLIMNSWNREISEKIDTHQLTSYVASYFWLAVPVVFGLSIIDVEGIKVLAGDRYSSVPYLTPLLAVTFALNGMSFVYLAGLLYTKSTKTVLYLNIMAGVLNLVLNLIFVPILGIYGAAFASLISYSLFILVACKLSWPHISFVVPVKDILLSIAAGIFMLSVNKIVMYADFFDLTLILKIIIGAVSYVAFVVIFAKSRAKTLISAFKPLRASI